jgi:ABC-type molybdate transport system substrate-binding protein
LEHSQSRRESTGDVALAGFTTLLFDAATTFQSPASINNFAGGTTFVVNRAVVSSLRTGRFQVGIIFGSDVGNAAGATALLQVRAADSKTVYEGAVIAAAEDAPEALNLLRFFASKKVSGCWRRCGFSV